MDLFKPVAAPERLHPHFQTLLDDARRPVREELMRWAEGFPDRDRKFVYEFQTTFNSSFWEIYLYALFREYNFSFDWDAASPDFALQAGSSSFIVEAATANAAEGKIKEWEKEPGTFTDAVMQGEFGELNREAMIRLANALLGKLRAYRNKYSKLDHVKAKPFVIAVAPFEQRDFQYQYDRPIRAVLYDEYVDEDAYKRNPASYPNGPPTVNLGFIEKDNGTSIQLGIFRDDQWQEVSAILFSSTATWGKVDVMSKASDAQGMVWSTWGGKPGGKPEPRIGKLGEYTETLADGLQVFHNPNARIPLDPAIFRRGGVAQHYFDQGKRAWVHEEIDNCLHMRTVITLTAVDSFGDEAGKTPAID